MALVSLSLRQASPDGAAEGFDVCLHLVRRDLHQLWLCRSRRGDAGGARADRLSLWFSRSIATAVGFRSASVLREHFGGIVGTTPLAYRRAFGNSKSLESRSSSRSAVVPGHESATHT